FVRRIEEMADLARHRPRLLRGAGDVVERARDSGRSKTHEVELEILERQARTLELRGERGTTLQQVAEGCALALEQRDATLLLRGIGLAFQHLEPMVERPQRRA